MSRLQISVAAKSVLCWLIVVSASSSSASGQELGPVAGYQLVEQTVYEKTPVKVMEPMTETVYETRSIVETKPVWRTVKKERRTSYYKPVQETKERVERYTVRRPVTETLYRNEQYEETVYETATEMREEQVVVRKPITETIYENKTETRYRQSNSVTNQLAPANLVYDQLVTVPGGRSRLQRLDSGYYVDPATGQTVFRRRGLHWVKPPDTVGVQSNSVPVLVQRPVNQTLLIPETVVTRKPIQVTRYVESVETRKVPVEVRKPKTIVKTRKIPVEHTRYVEEERTRRVPYTETTFQKVEQVEPYEEQVCEWTNVSRPVQVPKQVTRYRERTVYRHAPRTVVTKVPVDSCGRMLAPPPTLRTFDASSSTLNHDSAGSRSLPTPDDLGESLSDNGSESESKSIQETSGRQSILEGTTLEDGSQVFEYHARPTSPGDNKDDSADSINVPETRTDLNRPLTNLAQVKPLADDSSDTSADTDPPSDRDSGSGNGELIGDLPRATQPENTLDRDLDL